MTAPSSPLAFTKVGPAVADGTRLWQDIAIGFEHTVDDGVLHLTLSDTGQPIPRVYRLPLVVTARDVVDAIGRVTQELARHNLTIDAVAETGYRVELHEDIMLRLISAVLGDNTIVTIASDPTVAPEDFEGLMEALLELWGFDTLLDEMFPGARGASTATPFVSPTETV
jgi:hypothetical protein